MANSRRQAVVIIHGIGEQRPMETLRGFLSAVLSFEKDKQNGRNGDGYWVKFDFVSEGFEHRQFTIPSTRLRPVTDVYEFYWAHLFDKTSMSTFLIWLVPFLFRRAEELPKRVIEFRRLFWVLAAFVVAIFALPFWSDLASVKDGIDWRISSALGLAGSIALSAISYIILNQFADAARYLDAAPKNVNARNAVRRAGVEFLSRLHNADRRYQRIIVCGHSLGSVIAYDILQFAWLKYFDAFDPNASLDQPAMNDTRKVFRDQGPAQIKSLQSKLFKEQRQRGSTWLVSDLVTMGSPLALADALLAKSGDELAQMQSRSELAACPPTPDPVSGEVWRSIQFQQAGQPRNAKVLKRSSVFASTAWTNIYFDRRYVILGDPVGGPVAPLFGNGVCDIRVGVKRRRPLFTHNSYWSTDLGAIDAAPELSHPLDALESALGLDRYNEFAA